MNFLSHYYLHRNDKDNFFTVGLTLPDVIGLHNKYVRLTERHIDNLIDSIEAPRYNSLFRGMKLHYEIDRWFHKSQFFKEKLVFLQEEYFKATKTENIAFYYAHILLEIIIDRYLLINFPDIASDFYKSYQSFDFVQIIPFFAGVKNFDIEKFIDFTKLFSNSDFLYGYCDNYLVINDLIKVTKRIGLPIEISSSEDIVAEFIGNSYLKMENSIRNLFIQLKNIFRL